MKGFTLVELLIVLAIIGIFAAIGLSVMFWIIDKNFIQVTG